MTEYTGFTGTLTVAAAGLTGLAEFSVTVDRPPATHPRSGKMSDLNIPGKLSASGTIKRIWADTTVIAYVQAGTLLALVGTNGEDTVTITDAFVTKGTFKFTDAREVMSDDATFAIKDVSATNPAFA